MFNVKENYGPSLVHVVTQLLFYYPMFISSKIDRTLGLTTTGVHGSPHIVPLRLPELEILAHLSHIV